LGMILVTRSVEREESDFSVDSGAEVGATTAETRGTGVHFT
jgi:hypothetical protein